MSNKEGFEWVLERIREYDRQIAAVEKEITGLRKTKGLYEKVLEIGKADLLEKTDDEALVELVNSNPS